MRRLVFSGHTHRWCDIIHADGTREITVPSLSWRNRNDPSFVMATVHTNSSITVQRCMLANESTMIVLYIIWGLVTLSWLLASTLTAFHHVRHKSVKPEWPYGKGVYPEFVGGIHLFVLSLEALKARITNLLESENDLMEWQGIEANANLHLVIHSVLCTKIMSLLHQLTYSRQCVQEKYWKLPSCLLRGICGG